MYLAPRAHADSSSKQLQPGSLITVLSSRSQVQEAWNFHVFSELDPVLPKPHYDCKKMTTTT